MKLKLLVGSLALAGMASHVCAQGSERIEITGSSIKRIQAEGALPVQTITRKDLEREGISSAEQLIQTLNFNGNGVDNLASNSDVAAGSSRGNNGLSAANLRMQGAAATLVLLNGRRVAIAGLSGGVVDLQQIPFAAIERIEILKDGASSLYGTDAIGGVINFITRKDYRGLQMQAFADIDQHPGGNIAKASVTGGLGNLETDRFNVLATLSYQENKALRGDQRDFVNTFQSDRGLSVDTRGTPYATVFAIGTLYNALSRDNINNTGRSTGPTLPGGGQVYNGINPLNLPGRAGCGSIDGQAAYDYVLWAVPAGKFGCAWDTGRAAVLQQPVKNTNLFLRGTLRLGEHELFAEAVAAEVKSRKSFSPQQISSSTSQANPLFNLGYPSTGAAYDSVFNALVAAFPSIAANRGLPLSLRWRCMPCGNREIETTADTARYLIGAEGPLGWADWDYRVGLSAGSSDAKSLLGRGYFFGSKFAPLINQGILNPFSADGSQTQAALDGLAASSAAGVTLYGGKYTSTEIDARLSGPVTKLPAGDLQAAVGIDLRTEKYRFNGNAIDLATQTQIFNAPFDSVNTLDTVKRDIKAVFAEVLIPVTKQLELTLSARQDHYTGFGSTTNPKAALRFAPMPELVARASYGTGFRVPTFAQEFFGVTETTYAGKDLVDPGTCPSLKVDANNPACASITPVILTGGKPSLGPEKSKQWSAGIVWQPDADYSVSLDWWSIRRDGTIQSIDTLTMVANYALFQQNFLRDPATHALLAIDDRWVNAGETRTKGLDLNARGAGRAMGGRWTVAYDLSYLLEKKSRLIASAPFGASEVGVFSRTGDLGLRWKHTLTGTFTRGDWSGSLTQSYRSGYADALLPGVANGSVVPPNWSPTVKSYTLYNASVSYSGVKNATFTFGIKNLLDTKPPFTAVYDTNTGAGSTWEPRVADPRLRSFTFLVDYKFF